VGEVYERVVARGVHTPIPYKRLVINYRKEKNASEELRILRHAIASVPEQNGTHHSWFVDRLAKLEASLARKQ
jgi:hypothetical protein